MWLAVLLLSLAVDAAPCADNLFKGVLIYTDRSSFTALVESLHRFKCTGGNAVGIGIPCSQTTINSTKVSCPPIPNELSTMTMAIKYAKCLNMKVFLHFTVQTTNTGEVWAAHIGTHFNDQQWSEWFQSYSENVQSYAAYAEQMQTDMFSIGAELNTAVTSPKVEYWQNLIADVRGKYHGKLTYGADKRFEHEVQFWKHLDMIGTHPYYRLANETETPTVEQLSSAWTDHTNKLMQLSRDNDNKPIAILEIGYRSLEGTHKCPACWTWTGKADQAEQAKLYDAMLSTWCTSEVSGSFAGAFIMGWQEDLTKVNLKPNTGYEFIGKESEITLKNYFNGKDAKEDSSCNWDESYQCSLKVTQGDITKLSQKHSGQHALQA